MDVIEQYPRCNLIASVAITCQLKKICRENINMWHGRCMGHEQLVLGGDLGSERACMITYASHRQSIGASISDVPVGWGMKPSHL